MIVPAGILKQAGVRQAKNVVNPLFDAFYDTAKTRQLFLISRPYQL